MPIHDDLGNRMKEYYENRTRYKLTRRIPVIVRIDGRAFHTFTKGFRKPFDKILMTTMQDTTKYLCKNIEGCVFGYTQSDEISLLLIDYKKFSSNAFFDYNIQKISSITASMATLAFNRIFEENYKNIWYNNGFDIKNLMAEPFTDILIDNDIKRVDSIYKKAIENGAVFDARCFNIPKEEVNNYFYWRQLDATRNSIEMAGHAYFSHKELNFKTCNNIQDMLHEERGINWNDYPIPCKRGTGVYKTMKTIDTINPITEEKIEALRSVWVIDESIPEFNKNTNYIEKWLIAVEE